MASRDGRGRRGRRAAGEEEHPHGEYEQEGWDEPRLMDFARKLVRGGAEVVISTQESIRERAAEVKPKEIPKEVVESVAHLTARTKDELISLLAREFKSYLEKMDAAGELRSILENYTLDVNMTVRLRPHDSADEEDVDDEGETDDEADGGDTVEDAEES